MKIIPIASPRCVLRWVFCLFPDFSQYFRKKQGCIIRPCLSLEKTISGHFELAAAELFDAVLLVHFCTEFRIGGGLCDIYRITLFGHNRN